MVSDQKPTVRHHIATVRCHIAVVSDQKLTVSNLKPTVSDQNPSVTGQVVAVSRDIPSVSDLNPAVSGAIAVVNGQKSAVSNQTPGPRVRLKNRPDTEMFESNQKKVALRREILETRPFWPSTAFRFGSVRRLISAKSRLVDAQNGSRRVSPDFSNAP